MDLKIKDVAELLQMDEKTISKWIDEGKIPCYKINYQYRFNREELNEWILTNKIDASPAVMEAQSPDSPVDITECMRRGGIYYKIPGDDVESVIRNSMNAVTLPPRLDKDLIIFHLLKREAMMPTAVGDGIAIPHPRVPILSDINNESISICFLEHPIDFKALDKVSVSVMFIVLSANQRRHLEMLFKISNLCRQPEFLAILKQQASKEKIFEYIEVQKIKWGH
jgi:PTS system nitrogen regulatory IIA component